MDAFFNNLLRGLITYHVGIDILLILGLLIYLRKFLSGLGDWRNAVFGLERDIAHRKLVQASTGIVILLLLLIGEFLLVTVIGPRMPVLSDQVNPTPDPFAVATATLSAENAATFPFEPTPTVGIDSLVSECVPERINISSPEDGAEVSGTVELIGSVNIENFGSYKYEFSPTGAVEWTTIAAGNQLKLEESLGFWFTSSLSPGTYLLRLVPLDNTGQELTPCIISVEVVSEE